MTATMGPPTTPTRRDQPLTLCVLVAAVVIAGYLAYFRLMSNTIVPRLYGHWPTGLLELLRFLIDVSPYALLAIVLAIWGRSARQRLAGGLCALVAGVADWGIQYGFQKLIYERDRLTQANIRVFDWTLVILIPVLVTLAWGLARRSGRLWTLGVLVAPALAWVHHLLQLHNPDFQSWEFHHGHWWTTRLEFIAPMVAGCLVCWMIEVAGRRPEIRSSA